MDMLKPVGPPRAAFLRRGASRLTRPGGNLVVMDASFNPMTVAHEAMLNRASDACRAGEALLLLSHANVDKSVYGATLAQRLAMLDHYAESSRNLSVAGCSHARFVDKAHALGPLYPKSTVLYFVVGYDTLLRLFDPRYYSNFRDELSAFFAGARVVAANRANTDPDALRRLRTSPELRRIFRQNPFHRPGRQSFAHVLHGSQGAQESRRADRSPCSVPNRGSHRCAGPVWRLKARPGVSERPQCLFRADNLEPENPHKDSLEART